MKIALIIEKFDPAAGGNERSTDQIARGLADRGHHVTVLAGSVRGENTTANLEIRSLDCPTRSAAGLLRFVRRAEQSMDRGAFDVTMSMTTAVAAMIVQPRGGTVRQTQIRNIEMRRGELARKIKLATMAMTPKQWALLACEMRTMRHPRVQMFIAISQYVADQLFHHYAISSRRLRLIPNAAQVPPWNAVDRHIIRQRTRHSLRLTGEDVAFLFAARNPALKGLDPLIEALAHVRERNQRAVLMVAGVLNYPAVRAIRRAGLGDALRWIGPTRQMDALFAAADVTVLPTWYDPCSKVILESLLHGVPAISTLHNGASQWIASPTGRSPLPSPFEPTRGLARALAAEPPAGRVIDSPANVHALAAAMTDLCDGLERERCSAATIGLANHISMNRHLNDLEELFASFRAPEPPRAEAHDGSG